MLRKLLIVPALTCALATYMALGPVGTAAAGALAPAVDDCHLHNMLTRHYAPSELRIALSTMPPTIAEYSNCYDVIQRQLLAEIGSQKLSGAASGGSGGSFLPTPVLVAIALLALAAAALGIVALRRRGPPDE